VVLEMQITKPTLELIEKNETLIVLKNRMLTRENKSENTLRRYIDGVKRFTKFMKADTPDQALKRFAENPDRTQVLDAFVDYLLGEGVKPINLKAIFQGAKKWLISNRVNNIDYEYVTRPKVSSQIADRIPTIEELRIILGNKVSLRDKAFYMLAATSGLREGTITTLKIGEYSHVEELGKVTVKGGPNRKLPVGKSYFTFCTPETREVIDQYLATREDRDNSNAYLFAKVNGEPYGLFVQNVSRTWKKMVERARLNAKIPDHSYIELHCYVLRKFFQTRTKLAGCRADFVDSWLGHHPNGTSEYLNDAYFRPDLQTHLNEYRKAVSSLLIFKEPEDKNLVATIKEQEDMKKEIVELKVAMFKMQRLFDYTAKLADTAINQKNELLKKRKQK
jgi:integrase